MHRMIEVDGERKTLGQVLADIEREQDEYKKKNDMRTTDSWNGWRSFEQKKAELRHHCRNPLITSFGQYRFIECHESQVAKPHWMA